MKSMNNFLGMDIIINKQLFVICQFTIDSINEKSDLVSSFEQLCQNIYQLMIKKRIAVSIQVIFEEMRKKQSEYDKCKEIFQLYFNKDKLLQDYNQPKYHSYCKTLAKPQVSFSLEKENTVSLFVRNAQLCDENY